MLPRLTLNFDSTSSFKLHARTFFFATWNLPLLFLTWKIFHSSPSYFSSFQSPPLRLPLFRQGVSQPLPTSLPFFKSSGGGNVEKTLFTNLKVCTRIILYICLFILSGSSLKESNWAAVIILVTAALPHCIPFPSCSPCLCLSDCKAFGDACNISQVQAVPP